MDLFTATQKSVENEHIDVKETRGKYKESIRRAEGKIKKKKEITEKNKENDSNPVPVKRSHFANKLAKSIREINENIKLL